MHVYNQGGLAHKRFFVMMVRLFKVVVN